MSMSPFPFLILEKEKKGGREGRERNIDVREKHQSAASRTCPYWGLNPQPRYGPWQETTPTTIWDRGQCSNQLSHLSRLNPTHFNLGGCLRTEPTLSTKSRWHDLWKGNIMVTQMPKLAPSVKKRLRRLTCTAAWFRRSLCTTATIN